MVGSILVFYLLHWLDIIYSMLQMPLITLKFIFMDLILSLNIADVTWFLALKSYVYIYIWGSVVYHFTLLVLIAVVLSAQLLLCWTLSISELFLLAVALEFSCLCFQFWVYMTTLFKLPGLPACAVEFWSWKHYAFSVTYTLGSYKNAIPAVEVPFLHWGSN